MNRSAPRSIDAYLAQLREQLAGADPALLQDALYDAEEYLRSEMAAHPDKSEGDVLELIASTYGAPDEVAAAYLETEAKVRAALRTPRPAVPVGAGPLRRFFAVYADPRAYAALFFMFLALGLGIFHFTLTVTGLSLSAGLAVLIIGVPFFLAFIGLTRVISLAEGRLLEAVTGERMPRRPVHPGPKLSLGARILEMLRDRRTWTSLAYNLLSLPLGVVYFTVAVSGLAVGGAFVAAPVIELLQRLGWVQISGEVQLGPPGMEAWLHTPVALVLMAVVGVLLVTLVLHLARLAARLHARFAKFMLVVG